MQRRQRQRMAFRREGRGVDEDGGGGERQRQPDADGPVDPAFPGEVARQERQHEEAEVGEVELRQLLVGVERADQAEQLGQLDRQGRPGRQGRHHEDLAGSRPLPGVRAAGRRDELLPQPLGMLAREFARHRVEVAHALDGHQERLVGVQSGVDQRPHLVAEVALELLHVGRADRGTPAQPGPPAGDLLFERFVVRRHRSLLALTKRRLAAPLGAHHHPSACAGMRSRQIPRSVLSTTCHCRRRASRCARPAFVTR